MTKGCFALIALLLFQPSPAPAQTATPTTNILTRVLMVESKYGKASIFSVDVDNREYWITAKHVLTGAEHPPYGSFTAKSVSLQILDPGSPGEKWLPITFSVLDTEKDVDIVVLAAPEVILNDPIPSEPTDSSGATLGGDCEFLGFPYGGGWRAKFANDDKSYWMPFIKHCTISALSREDQTIWVLDGINNVGFSGGPVIFRSGPDQRIMAVISGYHTEPADVIASARKSASKTAAATRRPKETVDLNSGFIIAYDISYAVNAIHKNPIGPLHKVK